DLDGAQEICDRLEPHRPDNGRLQALRAIVAIDRGVSPDDWERAIDRALELEPNDPFVLLAAARARSARGDAEGARTLLDRSREHLEARRDAGTRAFHDRLASRWG